MLFRGLLAALEDANPVVFADLRREAIPPEDIQFLIKAGYTNEEIEVLLLLALHKAHFKFGESVSAQLDEAAEIFKSAVEKFTPNEPIPQPPKRKIFNGVGKVLGGCIAGLGNGYQTCPQSRHCRRSNSFCSGGGACDHERYWGSTRRVEG